MDNGRVEISKAAESDPGAGPSCKRRPSATRRLVLVFGLLVACAIVAKVFHLKSFFKDLIFPSPKPQAWVAPVIQHGPPDPEIRFEKVALPASQGIQFTAVVMGPDGWLWAGANDGMIFRYPIREDGTLDEPMLITSLQTAEKGKRLLIGLCFDPAATADKPIAWVTHNYFAFREAPEWTGKISRLNGKNLETVEDVVINLPRSYNDHLTNQPSFGPDGALYIPQGSNSSSGAPDDYWGNRPERLLNGSILRLDVKKVPPGQPVDVLTKDGGGNYDPYARGAPLTIYAGGIRNAYDLVWARDGRLYVPVNGASNGGNVPAGNDSPALTNLPNAEHDWLFRITPGKYYGHPNPQQHHFVLNGGNPDGKQSIGIVPEYPIGTPPDPDWEPAILDVGEHCSADGIIEYRGNTFHGKLDRRLLICRYNAGSDILCVELNPNGNVTRVQDGIPGLTGLKGPLDIAEDPRTGNLYVSEYSGSDLILLRPINAATSTQASPASSQAVLDK
jgi:glucose/arabinose dehydrogenase